MNPRVEKLLKLPIYQRILILAGVMAVLAGLFVYFAYMPKQVELQGLRLENEKLQVKLLEDRRIAANLPTFKAEYQKMEQQLETALTELPNQREIPTLLTSIASLAKDNGLDVLRFKPAGESPKGFYAEVPVELKLVGSYHQVASFFHAVGNLSRIVNIGNLNLTTSKSTETENLLSVDCMATTFRFLEGGTAPAAAKGARK